MITATYAALLGLWFVILSARVFAVRGNPVFAFFAFGEDHAEREHRAVRGHGNFTEYTPLFLLLSYFAEQSGSSGWLIHTLCLIFLISRLMHGTAFAFMRHSPFLRVGGIGLTLLALAAMAILLLL